MILREVNQEEKNVWDAFVSAHPKGHVFQSYEWGEVRAKAGWRPLRFFVGEGNQIKAAITILKRGIPLIGRCVFYVPRGPVLDYEDKAIFDFLLEHVKKIAQAHKAIFLLIDPDISDQNKDFKDYLGQRGFVHDDQYGVVGLTQPKRVFRLDVLRPTEEIFEGFHRSHRRNIRLAEKYGITIEKAVDLEDLKEFYKLFQKTSLRKNFYIRSLTYQELIYEHFNPDGNIAVFLAKHNNTIISGRLILIYGDKAWDMYAGSDNEQRGFNTSCYLVWHVIQYVKQKGCRWLDFRGADSPDPRHPLYGLHMFKKAFGAEFIEFIGDYYFVYSGFYFNLFNHVKKFLRGGLRMYKKVRKLNPVIFMKRRLNPDHHEKLLKESVIHKYGQSAEVTAHSDLVKTGLLESERRLIEKYFQPKDKILNIGCGAGREAIALLRQGFEVTGIDLQPAMIEKSKENIQKEGLSGEFFVMDATKLDFSENAFFHVLMVGSIISHIPRRAKRIAALKEVQRVLKKNGYVIISTPNRDSHFKYGLYFAVVNPWRKLCKACFHYGVLEDWDRFGVKVSIGESRGVVYSHMYSLEEMEDDIEAAGLKVVECKSRRELDRNLDFPRERKKDYFLYFVAQKE